MINKFDLFPQQVFYFRYKGDLTPFIEKIYQLKLSVPNNIKEFPKELQYQSPPNLFSQYSIFNPLENFIKENIKKYLKCDFKIDESWANIDSKYAYSKFHTHIPSFISGVIYLKCPNDCSLLIHNKHHPDQYEYIHVQEGDIIFFDGYQPHSTPPNLSSQDKIIIAFNSIKV